MLRLALAMMAALAAVGCAAAPEPTPPAPTSSSTVTAAPQGGALLSQWGFTHAPAGFSLPLETEITDRVDAYNNITAVFTAPSGEVMAEYLRAHLADMGFEITADKNQSMLFTNGQWQGALTTNGSHAAISLRTDREQPRN